MSFTFALAFVVIIAGSLLAVSSRNILHAVFGLAVALIGVGGLFFKLDTPFVAVMEILIYVGGIAVTMIFAVMLSSVSAPKDSVSALRKFLAAFVAGLFCAAGASIILTSDFTGHETATSARKSSAWSIESIGHILIKDFNLAFETLSIILLLAIVGAIVISRKEPRAPGTIEASDEKLLSEKGNV